VIHIEKSIRPHTFKTRMKWNTLFTKRFPCRVPIMGAPMADISGAKLAFETCKAGGLGFIAAGHLNSKEAFKWLEHEIETFKELVASEARMGDEGGERQYPLCIGFISHSTFKEEKGWNYVQHLLEDYEPDGTSASKTTRTLFCINHDCSSCKFW
jgi:NAD(P)H-dependent flavin oxidoreductase YrpB (nitropropane dioxygenase family)